MQAAWRSSRFTFVLCSVALLAAPSMAADLWTNYAGGSGPGRGKRVVLVSGDEEYRSEETLPQLAKILSVRHGFGCTVLYAIDKSDGTINPEVRDNIPGLEMLPQADLLVLYTRMRELPDDQMRHLVEYFDAGKPIVALRTATHAFQFPPGRTYSKYSFDSQEWDGGFGRQVLGETWINHHGDHGSQSTRGLIAAGAESHPILRGIEDGDVWGPTDVYGVTVPLPGDSRPLILGQVLVGMNPSDPAVEGPKNDPMMPVAWTKTYTSGSGQTGRVFTTTMGASQDFASEGLRRLVVNACYWAVGLEEEIPSESQVNVVGSYVPLPFKFSGHKRGVKPADLALE